MRWGTRAIMPRISGRSGRVLAGADAVQPEGPQRAAVLGLGADRRLHLRDLSVAGVTGAVLPSGHLVGSVGTALGLVVGPPHAGRGDLFGGLAPEAGDLVGALEGPQPGDGGLGHVDAVGRTERLGQDVVDAGHLEDGPGRAAGDDAGTGRGRLEQHPAGAGLAEHRVGDRASPPAGR